MGPPVQAEFEEAVKYITNLPADAYKPSNEGKPKLLGYLKPGDEVKLKFYGYFQQAKVGPCDTDQPGPTRVFERAKWAEWEKLGKISKQEAMAKYVEEYKKVKAAVEAASK